MLNRAWPCIAAMLAVTALVACATPAAEEPQGPRTDASTPFVDAHVHLNDEAMQLRLMQRWHAERAVIFWGRNSSNDTVAESARRHPELFIPFASVSPERLAYRRAWDAHGDEPIRELDRLLATGIFRGIGEISVAHFPSPGFPEANYDPSGPMMKGILAVARRHRVPVLVHIEWTRMREFAALLEQYPDVPVIWAHGGYTPLFIARRMLGQHPNLHYELSARTWVRHPRSPDYTILRDGHSVWPQWLELIESMPDRFLVGTDASQRTWNSDDEKYRSVQAFLAQLTPATRARVARTNLLALVGLSPAISPRP